MDSFSYRLNILEACLRRALTVSGVYDVEGTRSLPFVFNSVAELPHKMRYDVITTGFLNLRKCEREKLVSNALLVADLNECFSLSLPSKL